MLVIRLMLSISISGRWCSYGERGFDVGVFRWSGVLTKRRRRALAGPALGRATAFCWTRIVRRAAWRAAPRPVPCSRVGRRSPSPPHARGGPARLELPSPPVLASRGGDGPRRGHRLDERLKQLAGEAPSVGARRARWCGKSTRCRTPCRRGRPDVRGRPGPSRRFCHVGVRSPAVSISFLSSTCGCGTPSTGHGQAPGHRLEILSVRGARCCDGPRQQTSPTAGCEAVLEATR